MIRAAVVGIGSMGINHARIYSELSDVHLIGVVDCNTEKGKGAADKLNTFSYSSIEELFGNQKPDIISVTVPTNQHFTIAKKCLEEGIHTLVEKPITRTLEKAKQLISIAKRQNLKLMVGHILRFNPAVQELKRLLEKQKLGRIFQISCRRAGPFPSRIRDVGVVIDLAPHDIDIMRFLSGSEPNRVYAEIEQRIHTDHEDLLNANLRFENGIVGSLEINWLTPTKIREINVLGEKGLFKIDDLMQDLYFFENSFIEKDVWSPIRSIKGVSEGKMIRYAIHRREPLKIELEYFIKSILNGNQVPVTGEDGLQALKIALALIESGKNHKVVEVVNAA